MSGPADTWLGGGVGGGWPGVLVAQPDSAHLLPLTEDRACDLRPSLCAPHQPRVVVLCGRWSSPGKSISTHSTPSAGSLAIWSEVPTVRRTVWISSCGLDMTSHPFHTCPFIFILLPCDRNIQGVATRSSLLIELHMGSFADSSFC